jgi:hypothetical protein
MITEAFLSHDHGVDGANHRRVAEINQALRNRGLSTWFDSERIGRGAITREMINGIEHTTCMLVFTTVNYQNKVNGPSERDACRQEFDYARRVLTPSRMFPVVLEPAMLDTRQWRGVFAVLADRLYINCCSNDPVAFNNAMDEIVRKVRDLPPRGMNFHSALPFPSAPISVAPRGARVRVTSVSGKAGMLVDKIKFTYDDGTNNSWGSDGGEYVDLFPLSSNEVIVGIEGSKRAWASHPGRILLGSFRVTTNLGRQSPYMGNNNYSECGFYSLRVTEQNPIIEIIRDTGDFCPRIKSVRLLDGTIVHVN